MSKLTKFITQPRRFLQDAKAVRQLILATGQALHLGDNVSRIAIGTVEDRETLYTHFVEDMARTVPIVDMGYEGREQIAILHESMHLLCEYVVDVARNGGFKIRLYNRDGMVDVGEATLFGVDDALCARATFEMSVEDPSLGVRANISFQRWERREDDLMGPKNHPVARRVTFATAKQYGLFKAGALRHIKTLLGHPMSTDVSFPIDVVYTWVNHRDPRWRELWKQSVGVPLDDTLDDTRGRERFINRDELRYSLRSVASYAPWVRNIFVVTNCAPPDWINLDHPQIHWVDHEEVIPTAVLPVFSSHSIESRLQHVPGLADHFLYLNDDFFLTRPTPASHFFESSGLSKASMERYGTVHGPPEEVSPDYLNAARNGRKLLEQSFDRSVTTLHQHTPYALRRDVLLEMEDRFKGPIGKTTAGRFRSITDISTVSFLYHHYAYLTGKGVYSVSDASLVKPQTLRYERRLQQILDGQRIPVSLCLNDGGGSSLFPHWDRHVVEFLSAYFPAKCAFEH